MSLTLAVHLKEKICVPDLPPETDIPHQVSLLQQEENLPLIKSVDTLNEQKDQKKEQENTYKKTDTVLPDEEEDENEIEGALSESSDEWESDDSLIVNDIS